MDEPSIHQFAREVFGDSEKAERWLRQPLSILNGRTPLEVAESPGGRETIRTNFAKIGWGSAT